MQAQPKTVGFKGTISFRTHNASVKVETANRNGNPAVKIKYKITGFVLENDSKLILSKNLELMNRLVEDDVRKTVTRMIQRAQKEMKADIFGIGGKIHVQHPYFWKKIERDWDTIFPRVPIAVEVKVTTDNTGRNRVPATLKEEEIPPS
ncbi:Ger(x)C family spore germination C-terminal domain-containing protein [Paenibacillus sp. P26]|nr:Ger(x)C family spore germination C-terminal domain-containing protein [Paenibacillus sp. P26]UUZ94256.1 Ger(x)C family spore germination C-terminal domain-containing protein [Paenibacillus sp. P25]